MRSYRACHRAAYVARWAVALAAVGVGAVLRAPWVVVAGVLLLVLQEILVRSRLRPYLAGTRTVTVTLTDREYRTAGPDRATSRTWSTFTKIYKRGGFWVLRILSQAALALPASALDVDQTRVFADAMRSKGLLRRR